MKRPTRRLLAAVASIGAIAVLLTGCSAEDPAPVEPTGAYAVDIAFAQENATSDFEREALADGVISTEEYDEAHQLWLACMEENYPPGSTNQVRLIQRDDGLYEYSISSTDDAVLEQFDLHNDACAKGTTDFIAPLYNEMNINPEGLAIEERIFQCLESGGLIADGYTSQDFADDWLAYTSGEPANPIGPLDLPLDDDVVWCIGNPD